MTFLGTGASAPSARRSTAACWCTRGGMRMLFDCGEGTQRQMQRSLGLTQVDEIYLTHFHADHVPRAAGAAEDLRPDRPRGAADDLRAAGAEELFDGLRPADRPARLRARAGRAASRGRRRARASYEVEAFDGRPPHSRASATRWSRTSGRGASTPTAAKALGVPEGPAFARAAARGGGRGRRRHGGARAGDGRRPRRAARS